jgi:phytoene desaturase
MADSHARYKIAYEGMVAKPMHKAWETIKVLPQFAMMRADRSIYHHVASRVKNEKLRMA